MLVVAPHPDDEVIGPGATLARHRRRGDEVRVLVLTSGDASGVGGRAVAAVREAESRRALRCLGDGIALWFAGLPDGGLEGLGDRLTTLIDQHGQGVAALYVPLLSDPHPDHGAAAHAVGRCGLDDDVLVLGYEVWAAGPVNVLVDVTEVFGHKQAALAEYRTALRTVDYVRSASGLAAYRSAGGSLGGRGFAEGFVALPLGDYRRLTRE